MFLVKTSASGEEHRYLMGTTGIGLRDTYLQCLNLAPGEYRLYCEIDWPVGVTDHFNVTCYGPSEINFEPQSQLTRGQCLEQVMDSMISSGESHLGLKKAVGS